MFLSFVNLLIQGCAFLVQNGVAKNLGNDNYGHFGILQSDFAIFCSLADFGMATLILAFFAGRASRGQLSAKILQLRIVASLLASLAMFLFILLVRRNHPAFLGELILIPGIIFQHAFFDWYFTCGAFWKKLLISKILHTVSYASVMMFALIKLNTESLEGLALCMVLSALPAWLFGANSAFSKKVLHFGKRSFRFFRLMYRAALPYALTSLASFAYLPAGLYFVDAFSAPNFLSAYNYSNKLIALASGFMVHFISSSLLSLHKSGDDKVHLGEQISFSLFIALCASPLFLFPEFILKILFFAAPWNEEILSASAFVLRVLSISLLLQAIRLPHISLLLKERKVWRYVVFISIGGAFNLAACFLGIRTFGVAHTALFTLTGDFLLTGLLFADSAKRRKLVL